jgi:phage terminase small subunit
VFGGIYGLWYAIGMAKKKKQVPTAENQKKNERDLTAKQQRFIEEYLIDLNAANAARKAGYSLKSTDEGSRLLGNDRIAAAIQKAKNERSKRTQVDADKVIRELARVAFSDAQDYVTVTSEGVTTNPSSKWTEDQSRAVQFISEKMSQFGRQITIKTHDKMKALDSLAKHFKLYQENPINVNLSWMDLVESAKTEKARLEAETETNRITEEAQDEDE